MTLKENFAIALLVLCIGGLVLKTVPSELLPVAKKDLFIISGLSLIVWAAVKSDMDIYKKQTCCNFLAGFREPAFLRQTKNVFYEYRG